jgi:hypothetical protein
MSSKLLVRGALVRGANRLQRRGDFERVQRNNPKISTFFPRHRLVGSEALIKNKAATRLPVYERRDKN